MINGSGAVSAGHDNRVFANAHQEGTAYGFPSRHHPSPRAPLIGAASSNGAAPLSGVDRKTASLVTIATAAAAAEHR